MDHGFKKGVKKTSKVRLGLHWSPKALRTSNMVLIFISSMFVGSSNLFTYLIKCCRAAWCQSERKQKKKLYNKTPKIYLWDFSGSVTSLLFSIFQGSGARFPYLLFSCQPWSICWACRNDTGSSYPYPQCTACWTWTNPRHNNMGKERVNEKVHCILMQLKMPRCNALEWKINNVGCAHDQKVVRVHPTHWYVGFHRMYLQV